MFAVLFRFLRSGSNFWLLSPNNRNSNGNANVFNLNSDGYLNNNNVNNANGVRPALSLESKVQPGWGLKAGLPLGSCLVSRPSANRCG